MDSSHPDWRVMVPHCGFDLHFSDNEWSFVNRIFFPIVRASLWQRSAYCKLFWMASVALVCVESSQYPLKNMDSVFWIPNTEFFREIMCPPLSECWSWQIVELSYWFFNKICDPYPSQLFLILFFWYVFKIEICCHGKVCNSPDSVFFRCFKTPHAEFTVWHREHKSSALWQARRVGWVGRWEGGSRRSGHMYTYGSFMLMFGRRKQNIVIVPQLKIKPRERRTQVYFVHCDWHLETDGS